MGFLTFTLLTLFLSFSSSFEHIIGVKVSAMKLEIITAKDKTTPNSMKSLPVLPPIKDRGRKTLTRTSVVAITTKVICFAPFIEAV